MALPNSTVLAANGLFHPDSSSKIYCSICTTDATLSSWENHLIDPTHLENLEHFNIIFERKDNQIHCSLCDISLDWPVVKNHARSHMILPWHKSDDDYDKYKIFFENRVIEWKNLYHCCICEATCATSDLIFLHITDREHQTCKKEAASLVYDFPKNAISYEFLVSESLISHSETAVECRICRSAKVCLDNINRHVKGLMHKSNKLKFHLIFDVQEAEDSNIEQIYENSQYNSISEDSSEDSEIEGSTLIKPTLEKSTFNKSTLNKLTLKESNLNKLTLNKPTLQESNLNQITSDESTLNKPISEETTLSKLTIQDKRPFSESTLNEAVYRKSSDKSIPNGVKRTSTESKNTVSQTSPCNFVAKRSSTDSYCVICNCIMFHHSVNNHVKEKDHIDSEREYGCDKISLIEGNAYHCKICDRTLIGLSSVYSHVVGNKHLKCLNAWIEERVRKKSSISIVPKKRSRENTKEIAKVMETGSTESLQKIINDNITLLENNVYYCKWCEIAIPGSTNMFLHLLEKRHLSLFSVSEREFQKILENIDNGEKTSKVSELAYQRSPFYYYLVKVNANSYRCTICDCILFASPQNLMIHVTGNFHEESMKKYGCDEISLKGDTLYYCRCCDIDISSFKHLQLHIKHEYHLSSLNLRQEQQTNELQYSSKQEIAKQSNKLETAERVDSNSNILEKNLCSSSGTSGKPQVLTTVPTLRRPNIDSRETEAGHSNSLGASNENKKVKTKFGSLEIPRRPKVCDSLMKNTSHSNPNLPEEKELEGKPSTVEPFSQNFSCNYIVQISKTNFYCEICSCAITASEHSQQNMKQHLNGSHHAKSLKKYGCNYIELKDGDIYYCKCCDITIAQPETVNLHIQKDSHKIAVLSQSLIGSVSSKKDENSKQLNSANGNLYEQSGNLVIRKEAEDETDSDCQTLSSIYIQKLSATVSHCKICNVKIQNEEIEEHIAGIDHATALKKYDCHRILMEGGDNYYCTCCKRNICGTENVRLHINGRKHLSSVRNCRIKTHFRQSGEISMN